jgi:predicted nucleic acid-binding protein
MTESIVRSNVSNREMVDTNVLIYAVDPSSGDKHRLAVALIQQLIDRDALTVSTQVLNEFYAVATRARRSTLLPHDEAVRYIQTVAASSIVLPLTLGDTLLAVAAVVQHGLSFWDALIWAAAKENGVPVVYTEDFQHGRDIEGVRIINPFLGNP